MLFSVVIPLYNKAPFIETALRSVLDQRYENFEVIVVDDGSTDGGAWKVAAIADSRVRLVTQSNGGVAAARNRGIREANGDYIAFLDADDYWTPGYLSAIAEMIDRFPECAMYATHFYYFHEDGFRKVPKLRGLRSTQTQRIDDFFGLWAHTKFFCTCSVVIRAADLRQFGICFPEGEQLGEDQDVWFQIAERCSMAYLAQPLVAYRVGVPGSLTLSYPEELLPYVHRLKTRYESRAIPARHRHGVGRLLAINQIGLARNLLVRGKRVQAMKALRDPLCARSPRYWLRVLLAACMPGSLGRRMVSIELDRFHVVEASP